MNRLFFTPLFVTLAIIAQSDCASQVSLAEKKSQTGEREQLLQESRATNSSSPEPGQAIPTPKPTPKKPLNTVCGNPSKPCQHPQKEFDDWELSFRMPAHLIANKTYSSAPFYAVIVKRYEEGCDDTDSNPALEPARIKLQRRFPANKVFADYSCPNMAAVNYDFAGKLDAAGEKVLYMDYIAVYAGDSADDAAQLRDQLRAAFPQAEVKRMTAHFGIIDQ